mmetsp:Transcript_32195/g.37533  ORF Transcript_32195/g.37533 Transcript_32195/m.37533 type:complete len:399 (-) Transcript_32195:57-1253(-)
MKMEVIPFLTRRQLHSSSSVKVVRIASVLVAIFYCVFVIHSNDNGATSSRHLQQNAEYPITQEQELFQLTLTGVPNRAPVIVENMYLEAALYNYLKEALFHQNINIYSVRIKSDQTSHYQRSLNENFNVAGDHSVMLNSGSKIDPETLNQIENLNNRVLAFGDSDSVYQLSILVNIRGTFRPYPGFDFASTVMMGINQGHMEIVRSLVYPDTVNESGSEYFKDVTFLVCTGIGLRDTEPYLAMGKNQGALSTDTGNVNGEDPRTEKLKESSNGADQVANTPYDAAESPQYVADKSLNQEQLNELLGDEPGSESDLRKRFNAEAVEFRLVSGIVFLSFCIGVALWNFLRVAAKKAAERKTRLQMAKKAYEIPDKTKPLGMGKIVNNSKYVGTMDTGELH